MKTILALLVLFSVTFGQQQAQAQSSYEAWRASAKDKKATAKSAKAKTASLKAAMAAPAGTFVGTIPCADCKGISTELVLKSGARNTSGSFTMKQTYLGKPAGENVITNSGKWFLAKGNKQNPDAAVLQLIPTEDNVELLYFLQVSESEIKLLDREQQEIKSRLNYSLKKRQR